MLLQGTICFAAAVALGAKESTLVNNLFTFVNLGIVLFVVISGAFKSDFANWTIPKEQVQQEILHSNITCVEGSKEITPDSCGVGGFAPYGLPGIIKGAASCFYGFIGFDTIATAGEEAKTPQKSIPIAMILSLFVIFLAYFGISTVLTMMLPYYEQDIKAPLPTVFEKIGWPVARYIVSVGAICGLCSSLFGALFPLPRIIYAMASDGLIFRFLSKVHPRFQTPFLGTMLAGLLTGLMSAIFELEQLFTMMSIGTLLAYSMVAGCVLILRYDCSHDEEADVVGGKPSFSDMCKQGFNFKTTTATRTSSGFVTWAVSLFGGFSNGSNLFV